MGIVSLDEVFSCSFESLGKSSERFEKAVSALFALLGRLGKVNFTELLLLHIDLEIKLTSCNFYQKQTYKFVFLS